MHRFEKQIVLEHLQHKQESWQPPNERPRERWQGVLQWLSHVGNCESHNPYYVRYTEYAIAYSDISARMAYIYILYSEYLDANFVYLVSVNVM